MKLLIVDDDIKTGDCLFKGLSEAGFAVALARTGLDGYHLAISGDFDLIILDHMLPDVDGWRIVHSLRQAGNRTPVMFLTARAGVDDPVKGLELGGEDYLVKPFSFSALLARIRTISRHRAAQWPIDVLMVADLVLDLRGHVATRAGRRINLSLKEFFLLELLARRQGQVLPRSLIACLVWDMNFNSDSNVIDVAIHRLRTKVDDDFEPKLIHTVRGMGYKLAPPDEDAAA